MTDEKIVEGIRNKNEACLKEIIASYGKLVYSIIYKLVADIDRQAVEELASNTFFDLWTAICSNYLDVEHKETLRMKGFFMFKKSE